MTDRTHDRCGTCGALLAPGADWCSLCLAPVAATPTEATTAPAEPTEQLLARLRAESARQRPLGGGRLAGASRGALLALGVLLALGASAVLVGLLWLLGLAL